MDPDKKTKRLKENPIHRFCSIDHPFSGHFNCVAHAYVEIFIR